MYANLLREMAAHKVKQVDLARFLGKDRKSIHYQINKGRFSLQEAFKIQNEFFPTYEMPYLFDNSNHQ